jgi:glycosyltransferase involved in cell wall biosynthesis
MTGGQPGAGGGAAGEPFISVIVPTHGRPESLARCLESLAELEYPADRFEVIVVDDGSPRPAGPVACVRSHPNLRIVRQRRAGPGRARNTGAAEARGEFLAFTDDDCRPDRLWLTFLSERLLTDPQIAVGGTTVNTLSENPYSAASQLLIDYLYAAFNPDPNRASFLASNNFALPASGFRALSGFSEGYRHAAGEDRDLCARWLESGRRLAHVPQAIVRHEHRLTIAGFFQQHFTYGRGAAVHRSESARRLESSLRMEPWSFYFDLIRFPFRHASGGRAWTLAALLLFSQAANAAGFLAGYLRPESTP